jgi:hypothetical protein
MSKVFLDLGRLIIRRIHVLPECRLESDAEKLAQPKPSEEQERFAVDPSVEN